MTCSPDFINVNCLNRNLTVGILVIPTADDVGIKHLIVNHNSVVKYSESLQVFYWGDVGCWSLMPLQPPWNGH